MLNSLTLDRPAGGTSGTPVPPVVSAPGDPSAGKRGRGKRARARSALRGLAGKAANEKPVGGLPPGAPRAGGPALSRAAQRRVALRKAGAAPLTTVDPPEWLTGRNVRRAIQAVVAVSLVAIPGLLAVNGKTLTIDLNGDVRTVGAYGATVEQVLANQHIEVGRDDVVQPSLDSHARKDGTIVVRTSREVTLEIDGQEVTVTTTAGTVGELLAAMGPRGDGALSTASRTAVLGRAPVRVSTVKTVHVSVDGSVLPIQSTRSTIQEVLDGAGITLGEGDVTSVPLRAAAVDGMVVLVNRGAHSGETVTEVVPFGTQEQPNAQLPEGYRKVKSRGVPGEAVVTYAVKVLGGAVVERTELSREVTRAPVDELVVVGTLDISSAPVDAGSARAIAKAMAAERGWGDGEFSCLDQLWQKESGWRWNAENSSSGAYGIPQALPGSKMATAGDDWQTNPATQISWGLGYIANRYGTPCGAWAHSVDVGWY